MSANEFGDPFDQDLDDAAPSITVNPAWYATTAIMIERYRVHFEVYPEQTVEEREVRNVGFLVELVGYWPVDEGAPPRPGSDAWRQVYLALIRIARIVEPREHKLVEYAIAPFRSSIRYNPDEEAAYVLQIRVVHEEDPNKPVDDPEQRCFEKLKSHLRSLGAEQL